MHTYISGHLSVFESIKWFSPNILLSRYQARWPSGQNRPLPQESKANSPFPKEDGPENFKPNAGGSVGSPWSDLQTFLSPQEEMKDLEHQYPSAKPSKGSPIHAQRVERAVDLEATGYTWVLACHFECWVTLGKSLNSSGSPGNPLSVERGSFTFGDLLYLVPMAGWHDFQWGLCDSAIPSSWGTGRKRAFGRKMSGGPDNQYRTNRQTLTWQLYSEHTTSLLPISWFAQKSLLIQGPLTWASILSDEGILTVLFLQDSKVSVA